MKYWEIIADTLKNAGWSLGWVSAVDSEGRTIWIADAHRGDGKRYVVRPDRIVDRVSGTRIWGAQAADLSFSVACRKFIERSLRCCLGMHVKSSASCDDNRLAASLCSREFQSTRASGVGRRCASISPFVVSVRFYRCRRRFSLP